MGLRRRGGPVEAEFPRRFFAGRHSHPAGCSRVSFRSLKDKPTGSNLKMKDFPHIQLPPAFALAFLFWRR